jgi:hypothetical protein
MAVLVTLLAVVLLLLALLVAGLLRSHAEILRELHGLGVDMDPARDGHDHDHDHDGAGLTTAVDAPTTRGGSGSGVRSKEVPKRPSRSASDLVGVSPTLDAVGIAVTGVEQFTLLAFLSSGCGSCLDFWDAFREQGPIEIPGDARLVCVTKDPAEESVAHIQRLAPTGVPTVMSSAAWTAYDVPVAPFFVLVDGPSGEVVGEGAANEWGHVQSLLHNALDDAGLLDRKGRVKPGAKMRANADVVREQRADRDLLAAGIRPGDSSLFTIPDDAQGVPQGGDPQPGELEPE